MQDRKIKPRLFQKKIEQGWKDIMGPWIARETRAIRVHGGHLTIEIESAALKQELHYSREKIQERVNELLGEEYIKDVTIR